MLSRSTTYRTDKALGFDLSYEPIEDSVDVTNTPTGYVVRYLAVDVDPPNPRKDFDNLGTMICGHKRYHLGDKSIGKAAEFVGWDNLKESLEAEGAVVVLPLYLYDHSGLIISTKPFGDSWDSMQVGFIYVNKDTALKEFGSVYSPEEYDKKHLIQCLEGEVETYDQYLRGEVYGVVKETFNSNKDQVDEDACWGYYGLEYARGQVKNFEKDDTETKPAPTRKIEFEREAA